ncbi:MAG: hypothetical protein HKM93_19935 [Desulfobacteraceae bacterium]|nr:hypothetical protein [Desulfobacteraceae bacterium]
MKTYETLKTELLNINGILTGLFETARSIPGLKNQSFDQWEDTCTGITKDTTSDDIHVAVVGTIKSGKSTFVNTLLTGDYLKRGAGVVTSIVTRVVGGEHKQAHLFFKSWDEVNHDIQQALILFPDDRFSSTDNFDIRRQKDREELERAISSLSADQLFTKDMRNVNSVLLSSYLNGYDRVHDIVASDSTELHFDPDHFPDHREFVSSDALSVYLSDIRLEVADTKLGDHIEIADCQGSDSPNPLHLAMIQDYLYRTNLIVYVVSSRTGVRQADIRFLSMIKKMAIIDNILFVVNCDFSEHDSLGDLENGIEKIHEELKLLIPGAVLFSFSGLYHLFDEQQGQLSAKDQARLDQWQQESDFITYSSAERQRFFDTFYQKINRERFALLLKNHLERLSMVGDGIDQWIQLSKVMLDQDADGAGKITEKIELHRLRINQMKSVIQNTLEGAIDKLKRDLKPEIDRFFDARSGEMVRQLIDFIRSYSINYNDYLDGIESSGFGGTLYVIYQDFKQAVDIYMAENLTPEIVRFVKRLEKKLADSIVTITKPFDNMIREVISEHRFALENIGLNINGSEYGGNTELDLERIKTIVGIVIPPAKAMMRYSAHVKTDAVIRLGVYKLIGAVKKVIRKPFSSENEETVMAFKGAVKRIKQETERSVLAQLKDHRENIKFQYVLKLADAASREINERLCERFQASVLQMAEFKNLIGEKQSDRQKANDILKDMGQTAGEIGDRIDAVREGLSQLVQETME